MFIILTLIEQCDNKEWALHSMVMPILLLLCIRKEHVDSKVYKYEGICILYVYDSICITFGLIGANMFKGAFPKIATTDLSYKTDQTISLMDTIVNIFPSNFVSPMVEANMLQVIVTALILGFGIILLGEGERNTRLVTACNDLNDVFMKCMEMILKLSPIGVFCLLSPVIASNGPAIIGSLAMVLTSVGLPVDGIALVAGVDRIFDMGRTVVNITGDASCCIIVSNMERKKDAKREIANGL